MRIFLTGASGYLGGVLLERFARMPEVSAITAVGLRPPEFPSAKVVFQHLDIRAPALAAAMKGHDVVVHTACVVLWPACMPARERDDINLNGIRNVASAVLESGAPHLIHTSSMAAYDPEQARGKSGIAEDFPLGNGRSRFYYWNAKAHAERVLREVLASASVRLTMFRPIYIIGPRNRATAQSYRANAVNFPGRNPRRQFVHEADVADAFVQALRTDMPGAYNVVPDDYLRIAEVWREVGARRVPTVPAWIACGIAWLRWRFWRSPIHPSWVADMLIDLTGANARLKAAGWRPAFGSAAALRSAL